MASTIGPEKNGSAVNWKRWWSSLSTALCQNRSSGELGAFLSGGIDSSTIVGMMARRDQGPVKAFSIGFQEQSFNELEYAEIAAKKFGAEHYTYLVGPEDCFDALPRMVASFDEPFGNSSAIPTYFCARLAAQHGVGILLAGDGGDEMFGGNEWYATDKIFGAYQSVPSVLRKGLDRASTGRAADAQRSDGKGAELRASLQSAGP